MASSAPLAAELPRSPTRTPPSQSMALERWPVEPHQLAHLGELLRLRRTSEDGTRRVSGEQLGADENERRDDERSRPPRIRRSARRAKRLVRSGAAADRRGHRERHPPHFVARGERRPHFLTSAARRPGSSTRPG